jgi:hypothetical protein
MSTPIQPTQGTNPTGPVPGSRSATGTQRTGGASFALPSGGAAVALDTLPASPPQQVLDEMASAASTYDSLRAAGRELHFAHDGQSGRMTIEVRDPGGQVLRTLSPAQALDVAAGKPLE